MTGGGARRRPPVGPVYLGRVRERRGGAGNDIGGTLTGDVEGHPWTFVAGFATCDSVRCQVHAFPVAFAACVSTPEAYEFRISNLPNAVGSYDLDATLNASFFGGDSITVSTGAVAVYDITATTLTGGANVAGYPSWATGTGLNGRFQVTLCPWFTGAMIRLASARACHGPPSR